MEELSHIFKTLLFSSFYFGAGPGGGEVEIDRLRKFMNCNFNDYVIFKLNLNNYSTLLPVFVSFVDTAMGKSIKTAVLFCHLRSATRGGLVPQSEWNHVMGPPYLREKFRRQAQTFLFPRDLEF